MKVFVLIVGLLLISANSFAANGDLFVNGNVGIGSTNTDWYRLDVNGGIRFDGNLVANNWYNALILNCGPNSSTSGIWFRSNATSGNNQVSTELMRITGDGKVGIGNIEPTYNLDVVGVTYSSQGFLQASDIKFKENIASIDAPLAKILSTKGISFNWKTAEYKDKGFPAGKHYGVIAQDIEKVIPEVVSTSSTGEKSVAYSELIPVLIEAVKEQQAIINDLKSSVEKLKQAAKK